MSDEPSRPSRAPAYILAVTLAVVFGGLAILLGLLLATDDDAPTSVAADGGGASERQEVMATAGEFTETFLTFDYADLDTHQSRVRRLITASYAKEYDKAFESLSEVFAETKTRQDGTVGDVYLTEIDDGTARAVVVASSESDGVGGPRLVDEIWMQLDLVRVDGTWLVDEVTNLNFNVVDGGGTVPSPQSTTSTTAAG